MSRALLISLLCFAAFGAPERAKPRSSPSKLSQSSEIQAFLAENAGRTEQALAIYKKGCEAGRGAACLGAAYVLVAEKKGKPSHWFKKACQYGDANGCLEHARQARDDNSKVKSLRKACEKKLGVACFELAQMVENPQSYFQKGCTYFHWESCNELGIFLHKDGKSEQAKALLVPVCEKKPSLGCNNLGLVTRDLGQLSEARRYLRRSCFEGKDYLGCNSLGALEKKQGNLSSAKKLYQLACDHGISLACRNYKKLP